MANIDTRTQSRVLKSPSTIVVTDRTIVVDREEVYPVRNIAHVGNGQVDMFHIPWLLLILAYFAVEALAVVVALVEASSNSGFSSRSSASQGSNVGTAIGLLGFLLLIAGIVWNLAKPKHHGLLLVLNSGHYSLFVTKDKAGIITVAQQIWWAFENGLGGRTYQISINNSTVAGHVIQGNVGGDAS